MGNIINEFKTMSTMEKKEKNRLRLLYAIDADRILFAHQKYIYYICSWKYFATENKIVCGAMQVKWSRRRLFVRNIQNLKEEEGQKMCLHAYFAYHVGALHKMTQMNLQFSISGKHLNSLHRLLNGIICQSTYHFRRYLMLP